MAIIEPRLKLVTIDENNKIIRINLFIDKIQTNLCDRSDVSDVSDMFYVKIYDSRKRYFETKMNSHEIKNYIKQYYTNRLNIYYSIKKIGTLCIYLNHDDYDNQQNAIDEIYYFDDNLVMIEKEIMITDEALKIYKNKINTNMNIGISEKKLIEEKIDIYEIELNNLNEKINSIIKFYPLETNNCNGTKCSAICKMHVHVIQFHYDCLFQKIIKCLICKECWKCQKCAAVIKANNSNDTINCDGCDRNITVYLKF